MIPSKLIKYLFFLCLATTAVALAALFAVSAMRAFEPLRATAAPRVLTAVGLVAAGGLVFAAVAAMSVRWAQIRRVFKEGETAEALILEARDTGAQQLGNPVVELRLQIKPAASPPVERQIRHTVPQFSTAAYEPGKTLLVKFLPGPHKVIVLGPKLD
ncbi:MAG: hypothetical protein JSS81_15785 [Acidobacteria bacterium]|nr:hypothetical protein [Acidobacteriota bacterium]